MTGSISRLTWSPPNRLKCKVTPTAKGSEETVCLCQKFFIYTTPSQIFTILEQGQGPPLLLLHGNGADAKLYLPLIQTLARHFRVVAPDLPGFGRSPARESRQMAGYVAELELFINRQLRQPYHLMGHSMGGYLAYQLMLRKRTMQITRAVWMEAGIFNLDWKLALALQPYGLAHRFKKHNRAHVEDRLREWCWNYDKVTRSFAKTLSPAILSRTAMCRAC